MVVLQPHDGVVDEEATHFVTVAAIDVDGCAPWGVVILGKIRAEMAQVVTDRPQMVVDDVEYHGQATLMRGIHEALQSFRPAVLMMRRVQINAVITPAAIAGEFRYR